MGRSRIVICFLSAVLAVLAILFAVLSAWGVLGSFGGRMEGDADDEPVMTSDFSQLSWSDSFDALHSRLAKEYAFTEWKGVDWASLYRRYSQQVSDAEDAGDYEAYYLALRSYLNEIPDGHVSATHIDEIDKNYIGGGFGLAIARSVDHGIVVSWVDPSGPAFAAGVRVGMELSEWEGLSAEDALASTSTVLTKNSATDVDLDWARLAYLVRAPVSSSITAVFTSSDGSSINVDLTAFDDAGASLKHVYPASVLSDKVRSMYLSIEDPSPVPSAMVECRVLESGVVLIKVWGELDADLQGTGNAPSTLALFRSAVQEAIDSNAPGVIVDLRNNMGGSDLMSAAMLGSFYGQESFYEYANVYDYSTGTRQVEPVDGVSDDPALRIEPASQVYTGSVIALVNMKCVSSGEGVAMGISRLANGKVVGFSGTNGSFGLCGPMAIMPGGVVVEWPSGQSLDASGKIQVDSRDGVGGIEPTVSVPMNLDNVLAVAAGEDVELETALRLIVND